MKKAVIITLVLVIALASLGTAYALWDKDLYIDGTVQTGDLDMAIISITSDDPDGALDPWYPTKFGLPPLSPPIYPLKDVGFTEAWIDASDYQQAHIWVHNGYPCYWVAVHFTALNVGTIPVKLQDIIVDNPNDCITVTGSDGLGEQIDPGEEKDNTIFIHVEQCANEWDDYYFTLRWWYVQFNEYDPTIP
jgi:hypothetical protein